MCLSAAGALGPALLSAEVEEVPDGFDVTEAGSIRLDLSKEVSGGGRRSAAQAQAREAVARARLELFLVERGLLAEAEGRLAHHLGFLAVAERLTAQDSLLAGAEQALTTRFAVGESRYVDVLRLRAERLRTRVEITEAARTVELVVVDSGLGVPSEQVEQIFEPFHTTKPEGTGLGLALSKAIATAHEGDLLYDRDAGSTRFTLRLPKRE